MSLLGAASAMGVTTSALEDLIRGEIRPSVASKFGATSSSITEFINGRAGVGVSGATGMLTSTLQELRDSIGRDGAIGLVIGVCIGKNREKNR
jgi:hypothetical protein